MKYISSADAAKKWGVSTRWVSSLAKEGRIEKATLVGSRWMIPENAKRPIDGRTKEKKVDQAVFRYPIYEHRDLNSVDPPLTKAELILKRTREAFLACKFKEADIALGDLPESATDKYTLIFALHEGCMVDIFLGRTESFVRRYSKLHTELQTDFPYKLEMKEYIHEIDATLGNDKYYVNEFKIDPSYTYHDSFLPQLAMLSAVSLFSANTKLTEADLRTHEINCIFLKDSGALVNLQTLHIYLGCAYTYLKCEDKMTYHFKEALSIAEKHNLYYTPAIQYYYMRQAFAPAIRDFSEEFKNRLTKISDDVHKRYLKFTDKLSMNSIYRLLSHKDYPLIYLAAQGYANKEVAQVLNISEGNVGKRYGDIYALLGVKNKQEMIELYNKRA